MLGRSKRRQPAKTPQSEQPVSLQLIATKLERLTWRHRLWGVDERQVWHVVKRLDEMYRQLYREQQLRYEVLLAQAHAEASTQPTQQPAAATAQIRTQPAAAMQPAATQQPAARPHQQYRPTTPQPPLASPTPGPYQPRPAGTRFKTS